VGAKGSAWDYTFIERSLIAGRALWFYTGKLLFPRPIIFIYPRWEISVKTFWQYLFPLGILGALAALWFLRKKIGKGPLACVGFFIITLFPALGFFNVYPMLYSFVADHFQYLASIGLITLFSSILVIIFNSEFLIKSKMLVPVSIIIILILAILTHKAGEKYKDCETLWRDTLKKNPNAFLAHNNLGTILTEKGELEKPIFHFNEALRINPGYEKAHFNLGVAFSKKGDFENAALHYKKAIELEPHYTEAFINLGNLFEARGETEQAIVFYEKAKQLTPENPLIFYNLANALANRGHYKEAETNYKKAIQLNPGHESTLYNLAGVLAEQGKYTEALPFYEKLVVLNPKHAMAYNNLGNIYSHKGEHEKAIKSYKAALEIKPDNVETWNNLGLILEETGNPEQAIVHYKKAISINPKLANVHLNLGDAILRSGQIREAMGEYKKALELKPEMPAILNKLSWIYATNKNGKIRNAKEAIRLGEKACEITGYNDPVILDTLAAAYAEGGRFEKAAAMGEKALGLARSRGLTELAKDIEARIKLFRDKKPFRE